MMRKRTLWLLMMMPVSLSVLLYFGTWNSEVAWHSRLAPRTFRPRCPKVWWDKSRLLMIRAGLCRVSVLYVDCYDTLQPKKVIERTRRELAFAPGISVRVVPSILQEQLNPVRLVTTRYSMEFRLEILVAVLGLCPTIAFIRGPFRRYRCRKKGLCLKCGYNLTGNVSGICPECGDKT